MNSDKKFSNLKSKRRFLMVYSNKNKETINQIKNVVQEKKVNLILS